MPAVDIAMYRSCSYKGMGWGSVLSYMYMSTPDCHTVPCDHAVAECTWNGMAVSQ